MPKGNHGQQVNVSTLEFVAQLRAAVGQAAPALHLHQLRLQ
jgi:hypothetical protein